MNERVFQPGEQDLPAGFTFTVNGVQVEGVNTDPLFLACVNELEAKFRKTPDAMTTMLTAERKVEDDELYIARCRFKQFFGQDSNLAPMRRLLFGSDNGVFTEQDALYAVLFSSAMPPMSVRKVLNSPATVKDHRGLIPVETLMRMNHFSRRVHEEGIMLRSEWVALFGQHVTFDDFQEIVVAKVKPKVIETLLMNGFRGSESIKNLAVDLPDEWVEVL